MYNLSSLEEATSVSIDIMAETANRQTKMLPEEARRGKRETEDETRWQASQQS